MNFFQNEPFTLSKLRDILIRLEDTIIYNLIERSQFSHNPICYEPGKFSFQTDYTGSFMMFMLHETESLHSKVRRFTSPDEYNFTTDLAKPVLPALKYPKLFPTQYLKHFNINSRIMKVYLEEILIDLCKQGDDGNYGSSVVRDTDCLSTISKRIHYGKFIAEAKFCNPATQKTYIDLIKNEDAEGLMALLTNVDVEKKLLERVRQKAMLYGSELNNDTASANHIVTSENRSAVETNLYKINPQFIVDIYEKYIMPMTKEVQVEYLLHRLDCPDGSDLTDLPASTEYFKFAYSKK